MLIRFLLALGLSAGASSLALAQSPLGTAPASAASRTLSSVANGQSVTRSIWAPGQDEGFTPQGVAVSGGRLLVTGYHESGGCRLFAIALSNGKVQRAADVPACKHGGGVAVSGQTIFVIDTRRLFILSGGAADFGRLKGEVKLGKGVTGSLGTVHGGLLYLGTYDRGGPGALFAFNARSVAAMTSGTLNAEDAVKSGTVPPKTQGMAFDGAGRLWTSQSGKDWGTLTVGGRVYEAPAGIEGLAFSSGRLWTVSEAGSPRWIGWRTYFPLAFEMDVARLR